MNASIKQSSAPQLVGKWASHTEGASAGSLLNFMMEHEMAAVKTFPKNNGGTDTRGPGECPSQ